MVSLLTAPLDASSVLLRAKDWESPDSPKALLPRFHPLSRSALKLGIPSLLGALRWAAPMGGGHHGGMGDEGTTLFVVHKGGVRREVGRRASCVGPPQPLPRLQHVEFREEYI